MSLPDAIVEIYWDLQDVWSSPGDFTHFEVALTRRAWNSERGAFGAADHESMEWLGDRILGAVVAQELWRRFPHAEPGRLDLARDALTSEKPLAEVARECALLTGIRMGSGEASQEQVRSDRALSAHVEALIAASCLSGGWDGAVAFVSRLLRGHLPEELPAHGSRSTASTGSQALTALNARAQKLWRMSISRDCWDVVRTGGTDNAPEFRATVTLPDGTVHHGDALAGPASSAKSAAAQVALRYLDGLG